jgi:hypothetical protein
MSDDPIPGALRMQAGVCRDFGAPFQAAMLERLAADYEAGGPVRGLMLPWSGASARKLFDDAAPIRLGNAFTHLALGDEAPALAAAYPSAARPAGDIDAAWRAAQAAMTDHRDHLAAFMGHEPQTNEVRRSGCLLGGFLAVAAATGLPLRCFEIGASAGLNLFWDRFHYRLSDAEWGEPASPVEIPVAWNGPPPPQATVVVAERAACDRRPTDLTDAAQRRRLLACIWPGQFDRLARSRAAIDLALASAVHVDAADALDWTRDRVRPQAGAATVLYHSIFWQYLPHETRDALAAAIAGIGACATADAPFAWLRMEPPMTNLATVELRLTLWPGADDRRLGEVHPHGAWVRWGG